MLNIVIVLIIALAAVFAIRSSILHLKGQGSCCGGSSETIARKKKLDGKIVFRKVVFIGGMNCKNCAAHVQNALDSLDGLSADVNLKRAEARLRATRRVSEEEIRKAVSDAGYSVVKITD